MRYTVPPPAHPVDPLLTVATRFMRLRWWHVVILTIRRSIFARRRRSWYFAPLDLWLNHVVFINSMFTQKRIAACRCIRLTAISTTRRSSIGPTVVPVVFFVWGIRSFPLSIALAPSKLRILRWVYVPDIDPLMVSRPVANVPIGSILVSGKLFGSKSVLLPSSNTMITCHSTDSANHIANRNFAGSKVRIFLRCITLKLKTFTNIFVTFRSTNGCVQVNEFLKFGVQFGLGEHSNWWIMINTLSEYSSTVTSLMCILR